MLYRQRNTRNGGTEKLRQQQVCSIVHLFVYWPPVSVHCYQLSGKENAQVRGNRRRNGADQEVWGGCPRQRPEGGVADWQEVIIGTIQVLWCRPPASAARTSGRWSYVLMMRHGKVITKVVGKRESVGGMQERHEVFRNEQIHLKSCIFSGGKESSWKQRKGSGIYKVLDIPEDG